MPRSRRLALIATASAAALLALAAPAWAHVTVSAPGATSGGSDQEITFRVPVEKDVDTVALTIQLPQATPIADVLVRPIPGWTHTQRSARLAKPITTDDGTITEAVSQISWTANPGSGLAPGEYGDFAIIAGQLPDASSLTFRALQTYSDGSVVRWIETAAPGSSVEPENPAPVLTLARASSDAAATAGGSSGDGSAVPSARVESRQDDSEGIAALVVSIVALVLSVGALGFILGVRRRGRRSS